MQSEIIQILDKYKVEIEQLSEDDLNNFTSVEKGIQTSRKCLQQLRLVLRNGTFINKENEIRFFKKQKPFVYGNLKFFAKLYKYLLQRPRGSNKSKRIFIDAEIRKLQDYYYQNNEFIKYYRHNLWSLDEFYFLRGNDNLGLITDTSHFYTDAEFSTSHDNAVAKIMAYDLLLNHYTEELNKLKKPSRRSNKNHFLEKLNLTWLANKIDLVELIYALISSGAVKGDIKELATAFEKIFDIDLGSSYRTFLEIRARKVDLARFMGKLKIGLLIKIEESDN